MQRLNIASENFVNQNNLCQAQRITSYQMLRSPQTKWNPREGRVFEPSFLHALSHVVVCFVLILLDSKTRLLNIFDQSVSGFWSQQPKQNATCMGMTNYAQKWCVFMRSIMFEVTWEMWNTKL